MGGVRPFGADTLSIPSDPSGPSLSPDRLVPLGRDGTCGPYQVWGARCWSSHSYHMYTFGCRVWSLPLPFRARWKPTFGLTNTDLVRVVGVRGGRFVRCACSWWLLVPCACSRALYVVHPVPSSVWVGFRADRCRYCGVGSVAAQGCTGMFQPGPRAEGNGTIRALRGSLPSWK